MDYTQVFQDCVNLSYGELFEMARDSVDALYQFPDIDGNTEMENMLSSYLLLFSVCSIGVDQEITPKELQFFNDVTRSNYTYEGIVSIINEMGDNPMGAAKEFFDALDEQGKKYITTFCLAFLAVDETVDNNEIGFIGYLWNA